MARAFQTGVYSMQEIADYFGVHYSTVSRAVRRLEAEHSIGHSDNAA
jgi:DNA-binding MarR family transcriptional regulator